MPCSLRFPYNMSAVLLTLACAVPVFARADNPAAHKTTTSKIENRKSKIENQGTLRGSDVLATVDGEAITRRDLTNLWLKVDNLANRPLGMILLNRMRAAGSVAPNYTVTEADIYKALYSGPASDYATYLSNLVTNRLVAREAKRQGITVTARRAVQAGHELMDQVRAQKNIKAPDEEILAQFRVPRDIFLDEMAFRLRGERLLAKSIAARNGHAIGADDWVILRELFAGANVGTDEKQNAQEFAAAKERVQTWAAEVKAGKAVRGCRQIAQRGRNPDNGRPARRGTARHRHERDRGRHLPPQTRRSKRSATNQRRLVRLSGGKARNRYSRQSARRGMEADRGKARHAVPRRPAQTRQNHQHYCPAYGYADRRIGYGGEIETAEE